MARPTEHSIPPSQPAPFRHLGMGGAGGGGERPIRVHIILIVAAVLLLIAVPLYLMRHPKGAKGEGATASASASASGAPSTSSAQTLLAAALDGGVNTEEVTLDKVHIAKCSKAGPGRTAPEQCDRQPFFEEALVKAILENTSCAPKTVKGGTVSFALGVDYKNRKTTLFAGKSGSIKRKQAAEIIKCVSRSIPSPDWDAQKHEHSTYVVNVLATYPPSSEGAP